MKPIIIYVNAEEADCFITMRKEELEKIVDEAYKQGQIDSNLYQQQIKSHTTTMKSPQWESVCNMDTNKKEQHDGQIH